MKTLLILFAFITTANAVVYLPTDSVRMKEKVKKTEKNKPVKKQLQPGEADVRIQPNFMNMIY